MGIGAATGKGSVCVCASFEGYVSHGNRTPVLAYAEYSGTAFRKAYPLLFEGFRDVIIEWVALHNGMLYGSVCDTGIETASARMV